MIEIINIIKIFVIENDCFWKKSVRMRYIMYIYNYNDSYKFCLIDYFYNGK